MVVPNTGQDYHKKQVTLALNYGVSEATISNWIKRSRHNKNSLQLVQINTRYFIVNNKHNEAELARLKSESEDYQSDNFIQVEADDRLYEIMSEAQLQAFVKYLKVKKQIPMKYIYLGEGANLWNRLYNTIERTEDYYENSGLYLIKKVFECIEVYTSKYKKINLIDIGTGNFNPLAFLVKKLIDSGSFGKYIGLDISSRMLEIATSNFIDIFPANKNQYSQIIVDIETISLENVLYKTRKKEGELNIFMLIGATIGSFENQTKVIQNIAGGMDGEDLLICANHFDTKADRSKFATSHSKEGKSLMYFIFNKLNVPENLYKVEFVYNEKANSRETNIRFLENVKISFKALDILVNFNTGDTLNIFKHRKDDFEFVSQKVKDAGMELLQIMKHPNDPQMIYVMR